MNLECAKNKNLIYSIKNLENWKNEVQLSLSSDRTKILHYKYYIKINELDCITCLS